MSGCEGGGEKSVGFGGCLFPLCRVEASWEGSCRRDDGDVRLWGGGCSWKWW